MSLVAAEIERRGIPTVSLILMRRIAERVRPPRALSLPFPLGMPLGTSNTAEEQRRVILAALALLTRDDVPVLEDYSS